MCKGFQSDKPENLSPQKKSRVNNPIVFNRFGDQASSETSENRETEAIFCAKEHGCFVTCYFSRSRHRVAKQIKAFAIVQKCDSTKHVCIYVYTGGWLNGWLIIHEKDSYDNQFRKNEVKPQNAHLLHITPK